MINIKSKDKINSTIKNAVDDDTDKPIPKCYPVIDNDLARDNLENDIPAADLEDL